MLDSSPIRQRREPEKGREVHKVIYILLYRDGINAKIVEAGDEIEA